jgi:amidophosphoribosyltransferase
MCGIFGVYGHPEAANLAYLGLHALQHRGQESAGIATSDGTLLRSWRGTGLVVDVFDESTLNRLPGELAIGHVRYSTAGNSDLANAQPFAVRHGRGQLALSHNGNLVNAGSLRSELEREGSIFTSNSDSEIFLHLFARAKESEILERVAGVLHRVQGAYSLLLLTEDKIIAARDPYGFRPLAFARLRRPDGGNAWVFASETSAFNLVGAETERIIEPGEIVVVDRDGLQAHERFAPRSPRFCVFEHIYFARPDSYLADRSVYSSRISLGRRLAQEQPAEADIVIPVPDSGTTAALGFSQESGIPYGMGLIRSHYVGRTFIEPQQSIRHFGVRLKLAPVRHLIEGKRVCVVDDSLVRGTTSKKIVEMLRSAGAVSVHMRISAPPTRFPCYYGIDTPSRSELIASNKTVEQTCRYIGCDSLGYISLEGMLAALGERPGSCFCDACFSGDYPVPFEEPQEARPLPMLQRRERYSR